MKSIVATIQREQNLIIRNERSRLLVVQGAAGSGKTSAALQRVAYLMYRYRGTLNAEQVVLFSPNPMFNHYVSTVLPELGEDNMQQVTYQEYLDHQLKPDFQVEDPYSLLEYEHTAMEETGYGTRMAGIAYKSSLACMGLIRQYALSLGSSGMLFKDIVFRDAVMITKEEIQERFYSLDATFSVVNRVEMMKDWLLKELKALGRAEISKPWVDAEVDLMDNEEYAWAYHELTRRGGYTAESFDDYDRERRLLAIKVVQDEFKPLRTMVKQLNFVDITAIYKQLFRLSAQELGHVLPAEWSAIAEQTLQRLEKHEMAYEDATPYLDLQGQLTGQAINGDIRHLFIDEGQDYSPYQFAYLRKIFPRARMTVLGDVNQAIFTHTDAGNGLSVLPCLFQDGETETFLLMRSYRSTRPIVEFTRSLLPGGETIEPFDRGGEKPTLTQVTCEAELVDLIVERLAFLQQEGHQSIAVITKTMTESKHAYQLLRDRLSLHLIDQETVSYEQGIVLIPAYLAKGVEFDAVILYNVSNQVYGRDGDRKLFYTACTRAMHVLDLYSIGQVTSYIEAAANETYERR